MFLYRLDLTPSQRVRTALENFALHLSRATCVVALLGGSAFRWDGLLRWVGVWDLPTKMMSMGNIMSMARGGCGLCGRVMDRAAGSHKSSRIEPRFASDVMASVAHLGLAHSLSVCVSPTAFAQFTAVSAPGCCHGVLVTAFVCLTVTLTVTPTDVHDGARSYSYSYVGTDASPGPCAALRC